eukprot:1996234-Pyramimonas_sp.AAC.1
MATERPKPGEGKDVQERGEVWGAPLKRFECAARNASTPACTWPCTRGHVPEALPDPLRRL